MVDNMLTRWLRPHQREGVQFMFECVNGLRSYEGKGEAARVMHGIGSLKSTELRASRSGCALCVHGTLTRNRGGR